MSQIERVRPHRILAVALKGTLCYLTSLAVLRAAAPIADGTESPRVVPAPARSMRGSPRPTPLPAGARRPFPTVPVLASTAHPGRRAEPQRGPHRAR
jgi:hypothetical protein